MTTFKMTVNDSAVDKVLELARNIDSELFDFKQVDEMDIEPDQIDDDFVFETKEEILEGIREGFREIKRGEAGIDALEMIDKLKTGYEY